MIWSDLLTSLATTSTANTPDLAGNTGLATIDWVVIAIYGLGMVVMGVQIGRKQRSAEDYYIGSGRLGSIAVGISIQASLLSTISYLGFPSEMINKGPATLVGILSLPLAYVIVGYFLIPRIMARRITSAYEIIEEHLGLGPRLITVTMFLALRLVWMGLMVHIASLAVVTMLGLDARYVLWVVIVCSVTAIAYTAVGGLRAVVITDVIQFVILMAGALITIGLISFHLKGFSWIPTEWSPHWDKQPILSFDPRVRVTVIGSLINYSLWWIATAGADQTTIQRFMSTGSAKKARKAFLINAWSDVAVMVMLGLVGFCLLGFFASNSQLTDGSLDDADTLFPLYIATQLPPVVRGLVVAAMFAAVMSSLDSGINSVTAVVQVDLIDRFSPRGRAAAALATQPPEGRNAAIGSTHNLKTARILSIVIGLVIIWLNTELMPEIPGNIIKMTQTTVGILVCPMFGVFLLALYVRNATSFGAIVGTCYSVGTAIAIGFWDSITGGPALSFQWLGPCALTVSLLVGTAASCLPAPRRGLTYILAAAGALAPLICFFILAFRASSPTL